MIQLAMGGSDDGKRREKRGNTKVANRPLTSIFTDQSILGLPSPQNNKGSSGSVTL